MILQKSKNEKKINHLQRYFSHIFIWGYAQKHLISREWITFFYYLDKLLHNAVHHSLQINRSLSHGDTHCLLMHSDRYHYMRYHSGHQHRLYKKTILHIQRERQKQEEMNTIVYSDENCFCILFTTPIVL